MSSNTTTEQLYAVESKLAEAGRMFGAINRLLAEKAPALLDGATSDEHFHAADDLVLLVSSVATRGQAITQTTPA
jgi:hypothetical protein